MWKYAVRNRDRNIAVIVDEVAAQPHSSLFVNLLKSPLPNVLTIGAAVPHYIPTNETVAFRKVFRTTDLVLRESDEDVLELIEHWKSKGVASPEMVVFVSFFLLDYCGGHVYPTLAFMEYFFTNPEAEKFLTNENEFKIHFFSESFVQSVVYHNICSRCFVDDVSIDQM